MGRILTTSLGFALSFAITGCKQSGGGDSMGSMKMNGDSSMSTPSPATMPATMPSAMKYTCTMHPEVVADMPGKCPKCGMTLVAKK